MEYSEVERVTAEDERVCVEDEDESVVWLGRGKKKGKIVDHDIEVQQKKQKKDREAKEIGWESGEYKEEEEGEEKNQRAGDKRWNNQTVSTE